MKSSIRKHWQPLALFGLGLLGLALRLYGLNWDSGNSFHPDEREILFHVTALGWPNSLAQLLDAGNSPLNPHFFAYGSFPLYLLAFVGHILTHFFPSLGTFANLTLVGRVLSAIFDSGTIVLTGCLGLLLAKDFTTDRRYRWSVALLAAALVAFTPFQLQLSHFYIVDSLLLFFVVLTILASVALVDTNAPARWSLVAGIGYGLALTTKVSAAPLIIPLFIAIMMRWRRQDLLSALSAFIFSISVAGLTFLITMPYALLDLRNFMQQVSDQGNLARGLLDFPYVRQFAGTTPYLYEARNIFFWGLGVTLALAALVGFLWLCWRMWKRSIWLWLVVLVWVVTYSAITGSFYVKFMRYMLPIYPFLTLMAASVLIALLYRERPQERNYKRFFATALPYAAVIIVLAGTMFQGLALLNVYSLPNTRIMASKWIYSHIKPGSVLTFEQWDDPLPVAVDGHSPYIYRQATYTENGQQQTGLDLYSDDTLEKAQWLAKLLPTVDAITMPTDRLDKSIPRLPFRYPLTIHYYQLLFSGQLGFHLAAQFENHPNLFGITLDDSGADESYSVFDHPTARIFVRDTPYPYTSAQLLDKLLSGVQLPPPGAALSPTQRTLLLTPQQIADDQQSPSFGSQFPANSLYNTFPIFFWWLTLIILGLLVFPLVFPAFRALSDRGYIFSKTLGILFLAYFAWLLASFHIFPFSRFSLLLVLALLLLAAIIMFAWQRQTIIPFLRQHWRILLIEEIIFTLAFLLFVGIRSLNPDLWNIDLGGEKPMELAFLNAVLRSPYMPPYDPWFSGGYINYYYYGYIVIGALIKLTGIVPTTAFNLAIPTLFALTFSGAVSLVYNLTRRFSVALLGGYFAAMIGNFDGFLQFKTQLASALEHISPPSFSYWQSSRIIPFTINEFPFWSFLFADLHPHVIDMPVTVLMLGIATTVILSIKKGSDAAGEQVKGNTLLYLLAAFVFGTIACINPWDMPVYALILAAVLILRKLQEKKGQALGELVLSLVYTLGLIAILCGLGYIFYWPFYAFYQELYVNGLGPVVQGTNLTDYLTISGLWIFLTLSFFLFEFYRWWTRFRNSRTESQGISKKVIRLSSPKIVAAYLLLSGVVLTFLVLLGLKTLLFALICLGIFLFVVNKAPQFITSGHINLQEATTNLAQIGLATASNLTATSPATPSQSAESLGNVGPGLIAPALARFGIISDDANNSSNDTAMIFTSLDVHPTIPSNTGGQMPSNTTIHITYLLLVMGLCIALGLEIVYVRDFLDGGDYERMNTVFKFGIQEWLCFAIAGALVVHQLWHSLGGLLRRIWSMLLIILVMACSVFLISGTISRIYDHQTWINSQPPQQSANYTPTLDGFAFAGAWYTGDAKAIEWLNAHVSGSPVILEAASPVSYQWFGRVSVYTGLPDVLGWTDHVSEQRYTSQTINRMTDIAMIYTTPSPAQALALLHYYHVRYIYVGNVERQIYAQQSSVGLDKFDRMVGDTLHIVYRADGVTIYEVM